MLPKMGTDRVLKCHFQGSHNEDILRIVIENYPTVSMCFAGVE